MRHTSELSKGLTLPLILLQTILAALAVTLLFRIDSNVNLIATDTRTSYFLNIEEHRRADGIEVFSVPIYGDTRSAAEREFEIQVQNTPKDTCKECSDAPDSSIFLLYMDIENSDGTVEQTLVRDTTIYNR